MGKLDKDLQKALDELLHCIDNSKESGEYKRLRYIVDNNDEAYNQIKRAQDVRMILYNLPESESGSEYAEKLVEEYDNLCENTIVYEYLHAEVALGDIIRDILTSIVDKTELKKLG